MTETYDHLIEVPGITPPLATALSAEGININDLKRMSQSEIEGEYGDSSAVATIGIGNALAARIKAAVGEFDPTYNSPPELNPGTIVTDREKTGVIMFVTTEPYSEAQEVEAGNGKLVSEYEANEKYPADDPVVDVLFQGNLVKKHIRTDTVTYFSYPVSRLKSLTVDVSRGTAEADVQSVLVVDDCGSCGLPITTEMEKYIEDTVGQKYCDMACYRERDQ